MILLLAAVPAEIELLRRELTPCEVRRCGDRALYLGKLAGQPVALQCSGVGKANAAAGALLLLEVLRPEAVICFGSAGVYPGQDLRIGDLLLASEEVYGDEGAATSAGFLDMQDLGLPLAERAGETWFNRFPADPDLLAQAQRLLVRDMGRQRRVAVGPLVTVSTCSGTVAAGVLLAERTGGLGENMEGAAVAQICARLGVPWLEIRGISNLVEERAPERWDLPAATTVAQLAVRAVLSGWEERQEPA
jgi:futalosine hydrolase